MKQNKVRLTFQASAVTALLSLFILKLKWFRTCTFGGELCILEMQGPFEISQIRAVESEELLVQIKS